MQKAVQDSAAPSWVIALSLAFGTTVAMWGSAYFARLPEVMLPSPFLFAAFVVCVMAGGFFARRWAGWSWRGASLVGAIAGVLNLLILGSILSGDGNTLHPSATLWLPGSIFAAAVLAGLGSILSRTVKPLQSPWRGLFAGVACVATLFLVALGGLVTSADAGLAVVDWPNSFGYNMFLYPLSKMTGGIYYEHAHRLFGALVGLTTVTLAVVLQVRDSRRWVKGIGWVAVLMVILQGVLGGLRVTGRFTLSQDATLLSPSTLLAMVHGIFGQLFLGTLVFLAAVTSKSWLDRKQLKQTRDTAGTDFKLGWALLLLLGIQLTLGAAQRHFQGGLNAHMVVGLAFVAPLILLLGMRAWALNERQPILQRLGLWLSVGVAAQVVLGFVAFILTGAGSGQGLEVRPVELIFVTAHQWMGALLLALSTLLVCWNRRLLAIQDSPVDTYNSSVHVS